VRCLGAQWCTALVST